MNSLASSQWSRIEFRNSLAKLAWLLATGRKLSVALATVDFWLGRQEPR